MNRELVEHISILAAPIFTMLLAKEETPLSETTILRLADASIALARTLWLQTLYKE